MFNDKLKEACGVIGIYAPNTQFNSQKVYFGLISLQHRGQESVGIAALKNNDIVYLKKMGLVQDNFNESVLNQLDGDAVIGHVRYSTAGQSNIANAQPLVVKFRGGSIALAHNGNLINADEIRNDLENQGVVFQTSIDSEVIANLISRNFILYNNGYINAIIDSIRQIKGGFALVLLCENKLIGVRDPHGLRPLCIGKLDTGFCIASESCALDIIDASFVRDVKNGELVIIDESGIQSIIYSDTSKKASCSFEYVYFARPDSKIDDVNVYLSREEAGKILASEQPAQADLVIAVPDSGVGAAIGYSEKSGIPYGIGLIKNKYIGRSFIEPEQKLRELAVQLKLNVAKDVVKDKRIVLIDDSIVRGTTSKRIIEALKKAGATEVHVRVSSPPVKHSCYFGIDTSTEDQLVSSKNSVNEVCEMLGANSLGYISIEGLRKSAGINCDGLCTACFDGDYPIK